jgi:hypothetical protein
VSGALSISVFCDVIGPFASVFGAVVLSIALIFHGFMSEGAVKTKGDHLKISGSWLLALLDFTVCLRP